MLPPPCLPLPRVLSTVTGPLNSTTGTPSPQEAGTGLPFAAAYVPWATLREAPLGAVRQEQRLCLQLLCPGGCSCAPRISSPSPPLLHLDLRLPKLGLLAHQEMHSSYSPLSIS